MTVSKAQVKATNKYIAKAYDRINLTVAKGEKERIKAHADSTGESLNAFINRAISETMQRDEAADKVDSARASRSTREQNT